MDCLQEFPPTIQVADRLIGRDQPIYIIAEAGVSHLGNQENILPLVEMSRDAKVDAFKTQHYYTDQLVSSRDQEWFERLLSKEVKDDVIKYMAGLCKRNNLPFLCTAHNESALDYVVDVLDVPAIKVGSGELGNFSYLEKIAKTNKPVILSTGMHTIDEIKEAAICLAKSGCKELAILHCITMYPTPINLVNLNVLDHIKTFFSGPVGYSDHTEGNLACLVAASRGASIIEKHITLFKNIPNAQDWKVSCDVDTLNELVKSIRDIESLLQGGSKKISELENNSKIWATKSIFASRDIFPGEILDMSCISIKRPGIGLSPKYLSKVLGKKATSPISSDSLIDLDILM